MDRIEHTADNENSLLTAGTAHRLALVLLLIGVAARLRQYIYGRSMWIDELALAHNIMDRPFAGLFETLDHNQVAPVGFLLLTKAIVLVLGPVEQAFRLPSLLAGCGALVLFFLLLRRVVGPVGLVIGMGLMACMPGLVYYSNELKQYSLDLFAVTAVLWLAVRVLEREGSVGRWLTLAVVGLALGWFSHAVIFAQGGVVLVMSIDEARRRRWRSAVGTVLLGLLWAGQFAACYLAFYRETGESDYMREFWNSGFMPPRLLSLDTVEWMISAWYTLMHSATRGGVSGVRLYELKGLWSFLVVVGLVALAGPRRRRLLLLLVSPVAFLFLAAALRAYPISDRLVLFTAVVRFALVAVGGAFLIDLMAQRTRWGAGVLLAAILCFPLLAGVYLTVKPIGDEEARDIYSRLAQKVGNSQVIYCEERSLITYRFYAERTGIDHIPMIEGRWTGEQYELVHEEVDRIAQYPEVWVLATHDHVRAGMPNLTLLHHELSLRGEQVDQISIWGHDATLYRFNTPPATLSNEPNHEHAEPQHRAG